MCGRAKAGLRPTPLIDSFEIIRAEVRNSGIFATLNPIETTRPGEVTFPIWQSSCHNAQAVQKTALRCALIRPSRDGPSHPLPRFPCMGLSKSSKKFEQRHLSSFPFFLILLFAPSRAHPSVPPAVSHGRRAQGRSRIWPSHAVQHTHGISRPLLDGPRARREARTAWDRRPTKST